MKKLFISFILASVAFTALMAEEAGVHRFANYNVRYVNSSNGDTGQKLWANRKEYVIKIVKDYDFDIVGMEEVTGNNANPSQLQDLRNGLTGYTDHSVEREGKGYSYNSIFYKTDKYTLLDKGHFYVNEHPETPGIGWSTDIARTCIWVHLKDNASGQDFYFCTTHVNYGANDCGIQSGKLIGQRLKQIVGQTPVVLVGDFNMRRDDHELAYRGYASYFYDLALTAPVNRCLPESNPQTNATTTEWTPVTEKTTGNEFDYIFYDHMEPLSRHVITEYYPELGRTVNPSDHYPVLGRFRLGTAEHNTIFYANDETSLRKALADATMGDTICLSAGEYVLTEPIKPTCSLCLMGGFNSDYSDVEGKSVLTAKGLTGPMIDIPKYYNLELHDIVMQGADIETAEGGSAILTNGQKLKLYNCIFRNNTSTGFGAIKSTVDSLLIDSCMFAGNKGRTGAAVYTNSYQYIECKRTIFRDNTATDGGSAMAVAGFRNMNIQNSAFAGNSSAKYGTLYIDPTESAISANLLNNSFLNNVLDSKKSIAAATKLYGGAAVYVRMKSENQLFNMGHCTLMGNQIRFDGNSSSFTGAALNIFSGKACLMNNLVLANSLQIEGETPAWADIKAAQENLISRNTYTLTSDSEEIAGWENELTGTFAGTMTNGIFTASVSGNGGYTFLKKTLGGYDLCCLPTAQRMCESAFLYDLNGDGSIGGIVTRDMLGQQRNVKSCIGAIEFTGTETGVEEQTVQPRLNTPSHIYTITGMEIPLSSKLTQGVYILTDDGKNSKKIVKQ